MWTPRARVIVRVYRYLFVANFGDRLGKRYASKSQLWRQTRKGDQFRLAAEVPSHGATDAEHFVISGRHFLALANEGDVGNRLHQRSEIFELAEVDRPNKKPKARSYRANANAGEL